ncbi:MAG TPA: hypothetical protein VFH94_21275 [Streptomyces sp.]|nr:hypothetical protein [Streptomyces sp.]
MTELLPLCDARTDLTSLEQLVLEQLRDPAFEIVENPRCELQDGHPETHASLAQKAGSAFWWLVWADDGIPLRFQGEETDRRLYRLEACPAQDDEDECRLPDQHAEAHSYEMQPSARREPPRADDTVGPLLRLA